MSGTPSVGASTNLYPTQTLVMVPISRPYLAPGNPAPGYMQYPDGRIVLTTNLYPIIPRSPSEMGMSEELNLRSQLEKERWEHHVLKLAWQTAQHSLQLSRAREAAALQELQKRNAEYQQERDNNNQQHAREIHSMQCRIAALSNNLSHAERRVEYYKVMQRASSSTVAWRKKGTTVKPLSIR
jgi:hypothetical protein